MADSERALDNWVRDSLGDAYGTVPEERLPDEWLRLMDALRAE